MTAQREAIIREIYKAVERLGGSRELLAAIGSWGNTMSDDEVLECLQQLNAGRRLFDEVFASTAFRQALRRRGDRSRNGAVGERSGRLH